MRNSKYILITAAYNEAKLIENTIFSIVAQTVLPEKWIIVSDGSTDETDSIVKKYQEIYPFINLISKQKKVGRDFSSKVNALRTGLESINLKVYDFVGILDADVTFENNYYERVIDEFIDDNSLGIAGALFFDVVDNKKVKIPLSSYSVRGATQFFRRECFEQIGGLVPLKYGGEDAAACYFARMYGWKVKNFPNIQVLHHRLTGTADRSLIRTRFRDGFVEYHLGYHPVFQLVKCLSRVFDKPFIIGSILRFAGFWWATLRQEPRIIPKEHKSFIQKEQIERLSKLSK